MIDLMRLFIVCFGGPNRYIGHFSFEKKTLEKFKAFVYEN